MALCVIVKRRNLCGGQQIGTHWVALVRKLLLVQPSSAAAERVFSFLNTLSARQERALEDYIEASVMIRYNNNQRKL